MPDMEDVFTEVRKGGDHGTAVFLRGARQFYHKAGSAGLAQFVAEAFGELPMADQLAMVCIGLEQVFKNSAN